METCVSESAPIQTSSPPPRPAVFIEQESGHLDLDKDVDTTKRTSSKHNSDLESEMERSQEDVDEILNRTTRSFLSSRINNLYEAPEFVKRLNAFEEVTVGETVMFECQWRAFPKPSIHWYKDDEDITENGRYQLETDPSAGLLRLVIEDAMKKDEGAYKCKAENQDGVASTTGYLSVTGKSDRTLASQKKHDKQQQQQQQQQQRDSDGEEGDEEETEEEKDAQLRKIQSDRMVSYPPHLRTIVEQKSLEEREEVEYSALPPSPLQDFIDNFRRAQTWPATAMGYGRERDDDEMSSGSDTSVESQPEFDNVTFEVTRSEMNDVINNAEDKHAPITSSNGAVVSAPARNDNANAISASGHDLTSNVPSSLVVKRHRKHRRVHKRRSLDISSAFLDVLDSPWLYFLPLVCGSASFSAATELNPLIMVAVVALLSLVGFRLFLHERITT